MGEGGGFSGGGVEGWGENADNCNSITIKIKKKWPTQDLVGERRLACLSEE